MRRVLATAAVMGMLGLVAIARGQQPGGAGDAAAKSTTPKKGGAAKSEAPAELDLNTRYRFRERYVSPGGAAVEGAIGQYRVAFRESATTSVERAQAAPTRRDLTIHAIYQERPVEISPLDDRQVTAAVRHYETVRIEPPPEDIRPGGPPLFEGLTLWYQDRPGDLPQIILLTPGRSLRQREYLFASRQVFVPDLALALPELPVRAGDPYRVSRTGCEALLGSLVHEGILEGKLLHVRPDPEAGPGKFVATFDISGQAVTDLGPTDLHAQIRFQCMPVPASTSTARVPIMDAPGQITRLAMAYELDNGPTRGEGPSAGQRVSLRRELVLERTTQDPGRPLPVPGQPPPPTVENSWLTYNDPNGRFRFQHPQELQPQPAPDGNAIQLIHPRRAGPDIVVIEVRPKNELNFDKLREQWFASRKADGIQTVAGAAGPLSSVEWSDMDVRRFEAAMLPAADSPVGGGRVHFDGYVIQSGRDSGLYVEATTLQDPPAPFRDQVEAMLRTFTFEGTAAKK